MGCCTVAKGNLGKPPEWLMRAYLRLLVTGIAKDSQPLREEYWNNVILSNDIIDLIAEFAGMPVHQNAPFRKGEFSLENSYKNYEMTIRSGRRCLTKADYDELNELCASIFFPCGL